MIMRYKEHEEDLALLKAYIRNISLETYNEVFKDDTKTAMLVILMEKQVRKILCTSKKTIGWS